MPVQALICPFGGKGEDLIEITRLCGRHRKLEVGPPIRFKLAVELMGTDVAPGDEERKHGEEGSEVMGRATNKAGDQAGDQAREQCKGPCKG